MIKETLSINLMNSYKFVFQYQKIFDSLAAITTSIQLKYHFYCNWKTLKISDSSRNFNNFNQIYSAAYYKIIKI